MFTWNQQQRFPLVLLQPYYDREFPARFRIFQTPHN